MLQIFGEVTPPLKIINPEGYGGIAGSPGGLVQFLNNIVRLLMIIGGLWAFFNVILAGYAFLAAGEDPKKFAAAWTKIWNSAIGLIIIIASFILAGIAGWIFFGDATAILKPKVYGPGAP